MFDFTTALGGEFTIAQIRNEMFYCSQQVTPEPAAIGIGAADGILLQQSFEELMSQLARAIILVKSGAQKRHHRLVIARAQFTERRLRRGRFATRREHTRPVRGGEALTRRAALRIDFIRVHRKTRCFIELFDYLSLVLKTKRYGIAGRFSSSLKFLNFWLLSQ